MSDILDQRIAGDYFIWKPDPENERLAESWWIIDKDGYEIAEISKQGHSDKEKATRLATGKFMVHASNSYQGLVDSVKNLLGILNTPVARRKLGYTEL